MRDLQRVDIFSLSVDETMAFFLNLYNAMVIHAVIRVGRPGVTDHRAFFSEFQYIIGGYPYSLSTIKNGILRSNRRQPYSFIKPFAAGDKRLEVKIHIYLISTLGLIETVTYSVQMKFRWLCRR